MASTEKNEKERKNNSYTIDKKLLAYKVHYLLLNGAHVGVVPYLPVYAKTTMGCSATTVGILATAMQFSTTFSKPLFGLLADCLNQMKILIASLLVIEVLLNLLMLTLPPITITTPLQVFPPDASTFLRIAPARVYDATVGLHSQPKVDLNSPGRLSSSKVHNIEGVYSLNGSTPNSHQELNQTEIQYSLSSHHHLYVNEHQNYGCKLNCESLVFDAICQQKVSSCIEIKATNLLICTSRQRRVIPFCEGFQMYANFTLAYEIKNHLDDRNDFRVFDLIPHSFIYHRKSHLKNRNFSCNLTSVSCSLHCKEPVKICVENQSGEISMYKTYQFWLFCSFALLGAMCQGAVYTLSDTVCYERLRGTSADFGRQRLWGAVGWGAVAPLTGYLNDLITGPSVHEDYSSGWYIMTVLSCCFLINLYCMDFPKAEKSPSMCKDVKQVLCSRQFVLMEMNVFFMGLLTAYSTNYVMWYMASLGSNSMQMGLALAVACLLGNVPFMYFSGWLIAKLGHWNIITLTFGAFAARFGAYFLLVDPWMVLPVELADGITFGLFYIAMTSYGELLSTMGTEATIQGILGGTYQGLGSGVGCLLAGISFDRFGGRRSFLLVSILSACLALCQSILCLICKPQKFCVEDKSDSFKP